MRAIECAVPNCKHIHSETDEGLISLLVRHTRETHPDVRLDERAAEVLVDEGSYSDKKHVGRKGFIDTVGDAAPFL
jgi:hypothetical protein